MTPIIHPWVFYLMELSDKFGLACLIIWAVLLVIIGDLFLYLAFENLYDEEEKRIITFVKRLATVFIITLLISMLVPSQDTIVKMVIAQNITVDGVEIVGNTVVDIYNSIMNLFQEAVTNGG